MTNKSEPMETIVLSPESVDAYFELLNNPAKHGLDFKPFKEWFEESETVTANHNLYKEFMAAFKRDLPKIFFYIVLEKTFGAATGKDSDGSAGYHLRIRTA